MYGLAVMLDSTTMSLINKIAPNEHNKVPLFYWCDLFWEARVEFLRKKSVHFLWDLKTPIFPFEISWPLVLLFVVSDSWKSALRLAFSFLETCQIRYSVGRCKRTVPSKGSKRGLAKLDRTFIAPRLASHCIAYTSVNDY